MAPNKVYGEVVSSQVHAWLLRLAVSAGTGPAGLRAKRGCTGSRHMQQRLYGPSHGACWPGWGRGVLAAAAGVGGVGSGWRASGPSAAALARAMCSIACAGRLEVRLGLGGVVGAGGCSGPAGVPVRRALGHRFRASVLRWLAPCASVLVRAVSTVRVGLGGVGGCWRLQRAGGGTGSAGLGASGLPGQAQAALARAML